MYEIYAKYVCDTLHMYMIYATYVCDMYLSELISDECRVR